MHLIASLFPVYFEVNTHHIDGNPNNNDIQNLAVVCLDCHSKITGSRGLGKSFSPLEVTKYKKNWEFMIQSQRSLGLQKNIKSSGRFYAETRSQENSI